MTINYEVIILPPAANDLDGIFEWIALDSPLNAKRFVDKLIAGIVSLQNYPARCPVAPESMHRDFEVRHFIVGNYRILFTIEGNRVIVLHVRHAARQPGLSEFE